jgi:hypothetical protein
VKHNICVNSVADVTLEVYFLGTRNEKKMIKNTIKKALIKLDTKEICNFSNNVFCFSVRVVYKKFIVHICQKVPFVLASTKKTQIQTKKCTF